MLVKSALADQICLLYFRLEHICHLCLTPDIVSDHLGTILVIVINRDVFRNAAFLCKPETLNKYSKCLLFATSWGFLPPCHCNDPEREEQITTQ